jgi:hypothetical protein
VQRRAKSAVFCNEDGTQGGDTQGGARASRASPLELQLKQHRVCNTHRCCFGPLECD